MDETMAAWGLLAALVLLVAFVVRRRSPRPRAGSAPFHAVAVEGGQGACAAARHLRGARFLAREAPSLPLPACDAGTCGCIYTHFDDRRHHDRRDPYLNKTYLAPDEMVERRRLSGGRRRADHIALQGAH